MRSLFNKNYFKTLIVLLAISSFFVPSFANNVMAAEGDKCGTSGYIIGGKCVEVTGPVLSSDPSKSLDGCGTLDLICHSVHTISNVLLRLSSLVLIIVSGIFDMILDFSVVNLSAKLGPAPGIGPGIESVWTTLRDFANIIFIFILLWAGIQTTIDVKTERFKETVKNIIIVALLINFSLFFSKVVIDAGNIATLGFYNAIFQSANNINATVQLGVDKGEAPKAVEVGDFTGIFMKAMGIESFWGDSALSGMAKGDSISILVIGVMGSITVLILSIVFLIASVLFIARLIVLIILMVVSPIAFVGYIIPGMKKYFDEWVSALLQQSFFPLIFMMMLWVAVRILYSGLITKNGAQFAAVGSDPGSTTGLFLNFALVIGFIVAALIVSKQMASKTRGFSMVAGGVGAVGIGGTAILGRQTFGRAATAIAQSDRLRKSAASGSLLSKMTLKAATKTSGSSFDARALSDTKLGKATGLGNIVSGIGKAGGKGGYSKLVDEKVKDTEKYAKDFLGQTRDEKILAAQASERYDAAKKDEDKRIKAEREEKAKTAKETAEQIDTDLKQKKAAMADMVKNGRSHTQEGKTLDVEINKAEAKLKEAQAEQAKAENKVNEKIKESDHRDEVKAMKAESDKYKNAGKDRQRAYATHLETSKIVRFTDILRLRKEKASKVRALATEKSKDKKIADAVKEAAKEEGDSEEKKAEEKTEPKTEETKT